MRTSWQQLRTGEADGAGQDVGDTTAASSSTATGGEKPEATRTEPQLEQAEAVAQAMAAVRDEMEAELQQAKVEVTAAKAAMAAAQLQHAADTKAAVAAAATTATAERTDAEIDALAVSRSSRAGVSILDLCISCVHRALQCIMHHIIVHRAQRQFLADPLRAQAVDAVIVVCNDVTSYHTIQAANKDKALLGALKAAGLSKRGVAERMKKAGVNTEEEFKNLPEESLLDFIFKEAQTTTSTVHIVCIVYAAFIIVLPLADG